MRTSRIIRAGGLLVLIAVVSGVLYLLLRPPGRITIRVRREQHLQAVDPLYEAIKGGASVSRIIQLIEVDPHLLNARIYGCTSLYWAATANRGDVVAALLAAGADPNIRCTDTGETPIVPAVQERNPKMVRALIAHGADLSVRDEWGRTLRECAKYVNWPQGVAILNRAAQRIPD